MARDEGAAANLDAFLANLQAIPVDTLPEDDRVCTICWAGFVDGAHNPAIRLWCGHKFCKVCIETTVTGNLGSANLCPSCRAVLWRRPPQPAGPQPANQQPANQQPANQQPGFQQDEDEVDQYIGGYFEFLRHVFPCPALLTIHEAVSRETQRLIPVDTYMDIAREENAFREQQVTGSLLVPFVCDAMFESARDSNSWTDAAVRTAVAIGACSHPEFPGMLNEAIEITAEYLHPDDRLFEQEQQRPHDYKYWVCRWNEIQVSLLLSRLIGTRKTYWDACEFVYRGLVKKVHAFHGEDRDWDDPRFDFSLYDHLAALWPVVSGLIGRYFLNPIRLHRTLSQTLEGLHRPNEDGVETRMSEWFNPRAPDLNDDTYDLHGPYFAPFGDGREYWIDNTVRQVNPLWLQHGLWETRPAWTPERLQQVYITMAPRNQQ